MKQSENFVQTRAETYQRRFFRGQVASSGAQVTRAGTIYVPPGGKTPRPGDAVIWDRAQQAYRLPTSVAESRRLSGILFTDLFRERTGYKTGNPINVLELGSIAIELGGPATFEGRLVFQPDDLAWDQVTVGAVAAHTPLSGSVNASAANTALTEVTASVNEAFASLGSRSVICAVQDGGVKGDIVWAIIAGGRIL